MLIGLCTLLESFRESFGLSGEDHEFLEGKTTSGMGATVQDVEGRDGKDIGFL